MFATWLLQFSQPAKDSLGGKATATSLVQAASITLLAVCISGWFVSYKMFSIDKKGKKYYWFNAIAAILYLPFLTWHFFTCYDANFETGTEHYLLLFFVHSTVMVFWSLGFNTLNKKEEGY